ncbi:hypothetical protein [Gordonia sp. SID5947]|nr:hypothetical protein [Gordonia sp. SID5947]
MPTTMSQPLWWASAWQDGHGGHPLARQVSPPSDRRTMWWAPRL